MHDPPDTVIAALAELREFDSIRPKSWRIARDARHFVVEVDLGWTRRLMLAVPHGESRAEIAIFRSLLAERVVRA